MRRHLVAVDTYASVDPTEELARRVGIRPEEVIRLNANENPYGPSQAVKEAVARTPLNIYPDPNQRQLRAALGEYTGQPAESILPGAGADELIDLLMRLFIEPGEKALDCVPTFGMYSFCARVNNATVASVERDELFELDIRAIKAAVDDRTKIIFICSPNNPTGNLVSEAQAKALLALGPIVVVDETYYEFCGRSLAHLLGEFENLVILRTFSKWAAIAGLRLGYMIGSPTIVEHLVEVKPPYNINSAAEVAGLASLADRKALMKNVEMLVRQRRRLESELQQIPGVKFWPSHGNFLLVDFQRDGRQISEELGKRGIFVRYFSHPRLRNSLRISSGTPEQMDLLIDALKAIV
ncbi:MAG: histidinol-phosphate transaminase [Chloroflexi bacterium]|nr:histidinol-phosphate transaminase [Chloroflexota bacterium]